MRLRSFLSVLKPQKSAAKLTSAQMDQRVQLLNCADDIRNSTIEDIITDTHVTAPILSDIIARVGRDIAVGMTPHQIDTRLTKELDQFGLLPSMLGYNGFTAASAVSVSPDLLHAPPSNKPILNGSFVTLQLAASSGKSHASQGWTFACGTMSKNQKAVIDGTSDILRETVSQMRPGHTTADISNTIQDGLDARALKPIRDFCGYAMGHERIQHPNILGYGHPADGVVLVEGMILNIHVIATSGYGAIRIASDMWSARPKDKKPSALATTMVLIRKEDVLELTRAPGKKRTQDLVN